MLNILNLTVVNYYFTPDLNFRKFTYLSAKYLVPEFEILGSVKMEYKWPVGADHQAICKWAATIRKTSTDKGQSSFFYWSIFIEFVCYSLGFPLAIFSECFWERLKHSKEKLKEINWVHFLLLTNTQNNIKKYISFWDIAESYKNFTMVLLHYIRHNNVI